MDNLRALLILFVVFGHLPETPDGNGLTVDIYRIIYSFHMPAFVFITGYFARYRPASLLRRTILPYAFFQLLYCAFDFYVLRNRASLDLQFSVRSMPEKHKLPAILCAGAVIAALEGFFIVKQTPPTVFYCSAPYSALGTNAAIRLLFLICAFAWIAFLLIVTPGKRLPAISAVGQRTLPVFLLHGFIQRIILQYGLLRGNAFKNLLAAAALTLIIVALLSLKPIYRLFETAFHPERKDYDGIRNADAYRE